MCSGVGASSCKAGSAAERSTLSQGYRARPACKRKRPFKSLFEHGTDFSQSEDVIHHPAVVCAE